MVPDFELGGRHKSTHFGALPHDLHIRLPADLVNESFARVLLLEFLHDFVELCLFQVLEFIGPFRNLFNLFVLKLEVLLYSLPLRVEDRLKIHVGTDFTLFLFVFKFLLVVEELRHTGTLVVVEVLDVLEKCVHWVCVSLLNKNLAKLFRHLFAVTFIVLFPETYVDYLLLFDRDCLLLFIELLVPRQSSEDELVHKEEERFDVILEACLLAVQLTECRKHQVANNCVVGARNFLQFKLRDHSEVN